VYFTGTLYWITRVMVLYGGLQPAVGVLVNALLIVYLALFPALFALVTCRLGLRFGAVGIMLAPLVWVATELGRTHLLGGFPWVLLGYSQVRVIPIAQLASLLGVFGVSALVASVSAAVAVAFSPQRQPQKLSRGFSRFAPLLAAVSLVLVVAAWGSARVARGALTTAGTPVRVGLVQGNVDQAEKMNPDPVRARAIFDNYLRMTEHAIAQGADVVVWPESSIPFIFEDDRAGAEEIRAIARDTRTPILLGSDQIERGVPMRYYNSAYLVRPDGSTGGVYRKMHLVPFGEYVPLKRVLFFAAPLVEAVSDFSAGESAVLLPIDGHRASTAICYEIVYPDLVRRFVAAGSELLTTITNDAWFGRTSAPYQHFAQASMRAVENGRYLVRAANTGITGVVDPYGRVLVESRIFEPAVIVVQARFLAVSTLYTRIGDLFAYIALFATIALLVGSTKKGDGGIFSRQYKKIPPSP
jgi:apolipoprotein N-acyltransferase